MKFRIITLVFAVCVWGALATSVPSTAQEGQDQQRYSQDPKLIEFDVPGAGTVSSHACAPECGTIPLANNNLGAIVGYYTDANFVPHGFLRAPDGQITSFDAPGVGLGYGLDEGTVAYSVNDLGVIAGEFTDSSYVFHGFVRYPDGSFATFEAPQAGSGEFQGTLAFNINAEGVTAGTYIDANDVYHGFVRSPDGQITPFDPPGSTYTYPCEETCLSPDGTITGFYADSGDTVHGFVRTPDGGFTVIDAPGAATGSLNGTYAASINLGGAITGYFYDSSSTAHGFVRTPDGQFTTFDDPSASTASGQGTAPFSINLLGTATGEFLDAGNAMHGFVRFPDGSFANLDAPDAGTGFGQGTRPSTINLQGTVTYLGTSPSRPSTSIVHGAVTGWYVDAGNLNHGFVWNP